MAGRKSCLFFSSFISPRLLFSLVECPACLVGAKIKQENINNTLGLAFLHISTRIDIFRERKQVQTLACISKIILYISLDTFIYFLFSLITWDVRTSLRTPRLIFRSTKYPASPVDSKISRGWHICTKRIESEYKKKNKSLLYWATTSCAFFIFSSKTVNLVFLIP